LLSVFFIWESLKKTYRYRGSALIPVSLPKYFTLVGTNFIESANRREDWRAPCARCVSPESVKAPLFWMKNKRFRVRRFDNAKLTPLVTPVKSVLLLPSAEVNYSVRSPKLGASETRPYSCTTRFLNATICALQYG
jgi:hypothetical protein